MPIKMIFMCMILPLFMMIIQTVLLRASGRVAIFLSLGALTSIVKQLLGPNQGGSGMITNVRVEDINVETPVWRPFFLGVQKNFWGTSGTGYLKTWAFKNIYFSGFGTPSIILGGPNNPDQVDDIKFINLVQDGSPLTSWDPKYFEYTQDFGRPVGDIYFCANEPCPSFGDFSRSTKQHKSKKGKGAKKDK